jgi:autotransporter-associated beta strand protein
MRTVSKKRLAAIFTAVSATVAASHLARAQTYTLPAARLTTSNVFATPAQSSFDGTTASWAVSSDGVTFNPVSTAPAAGTNYYVQGLRLRTPGATSTNAVTFAGSSLTLRSGGRMLYKGPDNTVTVNNLILDAGILENGTYASSTATPYRLAGNITVSASGGLIYSENTNGSESRISSNISGPGPVYVGGSIGGSTQVVELSGSNTYAGGLRNLGGYLRLNSANAIGTNSSLTLGSASAAPNATVDINGRSYTVTSLSVASFTATSATPTSYFLDPGTNLPVATFSSLPSGIQVGQGVTGTAGGGYIQSINTATNEVSFSANINGGAATVVNFTATSPTASNQSIINNAGSAATFFYGGTNSLSTNITFSGSKLAVGVNNGGTLTLTGPTLTFGSGITLNGGTTLAPSTLVINSPTASIGASGSSAINIANSASTDVATLTIQAGTVSASGITVAGGNGIGTLNLSGGVLNTYGNIGTANNGSARGFINISGGSLNLRNNTSLVFGAFSGRPNTVVQTGGTVTFYADAGATTAGGTGSIRIENSNNYYYLQGGTLSVPQFKYSGQAFGSQFGTFANTGSLYLQGGTLVTSIPTTDFFSNIRTDTTGNNPAGSRWSVIVGGSSPTTINTSGNAVTFVNALTHDSALGATADGGITKTGAGTLTLAGSGSFTAMTYTGPTTVNQGAVKLVDIGSATRGITISAGTTYELNVNSGTIGYANTTVTGSGTLVKTGAGRVNFNTNGTTVAQSGGGLIDIQGGTVSYDGTGNNASVQQGAFASNRGSINLAADTFLDAQNSDLRAAALTGSGTVRGGWYGLGRSIYIGDVATSSQFDGAIIDRTGFGDGSNGGVSFTKVGTGSVTLTGNVTFSSGITVNGGILNLAPAAVLTSPIGGATAFAGGTISVAPNSTDIATLNIKANTVINTALFSVADTGNAGSGTVNQTGGTVNAQRLNLAQTGSNANATYNLSGGTLNIGSSGILTSVSSTVTSSLNISGGALNLTSNSSIVMGAFQNRPTAITQSGGTVTFYSDNGVTPGGTGRISLANADYSGGTYYRLNGGTLSVPGFGYSGQAATATFGVSASFYLNGGTLAPTGSTTDFFGESTRTTGNGLWYSFVGAGGAIIDTGVNSITYNRPLSHDSSVTTDGGLTKLGAGTLTFTSSVAYNGPTAVNGGTVITPNFPSSKLITVANGGTLDFTVSADTSVSGVTVSGTGSLIKRGGGTLLFTGNTTSGGLTAGSLIDVQAGTLKLSDFNGKQSDWSTNQSDLNIASGATLAANQCDLTVGKLTGAGTYSSGWFFYRTLTVGTGDVSSQFDGVIVGNGAQNPGAVYPNLGTTALTKVGTGTLTLTGNNTYQGPTTVSGGVLTVTKPLTPVTGSLVVTGAGATLNLNAPATPTASASYTRSGEFSSITVSATGSVYLQPSDRSTNNASVLVTSGLSLTTGGTIDLGNGDLIIKGGAAALTTVQGWIGSGALSASASLLSSPNYLPYTTLAVLANDSGDQTNPYFTSYDGVGGLAVGDLIVKYTYVGDTNLDGVLDGRDFKNVMEGFITGQSGWAWGDVDNSGGTVTAQDVTTFVTAYNYYQSNEQTALGAGQDAGTSSTSTIPEPAFLSLLVGIAPLVSRRRRR